MTIIEKEMPRLLRPRLVKAKHRTRDVAFPFRMATGFAGDVNRTHPADIAAYLNDPTNPILGYGFGCLYTSSANTVRQLASGDASSTAVNIAGVSVRPYPYQQAAATNFGAVPFGNIAPPTTGPNQVIDILKSGFIMVAVNGAVVLGGLVYIWCAASSGAHIQGGFESAASAGNTLLLDGKSYWNGPAGPDGIAELAFNL